MIMYLKTSSCIVYFKITLKKNDSIQYRVFPVEMLVMFTSVETLGRGCSSPPVSKSGFGWEVRDFMLMCWKV